MLLLFVLLRLAHGKPVGCDIFIVFGQCGGEYRASTGIRAGGYKVEIIRMRRVECCFDRRQSWI